METTLTECIHGMQPEWCSLCLHPPTEKPKPKQKVTVADVEDLVAEGDYEVLNRRDRIALDYDGFESPTGLWIDKVRFPSGHIAYVAFGYSGAKTFRTLAQAKAHLDNETRT